MAWMSRKEVPTSSSWRATGVPSRSSAPIMSRWKRRCRREKAKGRDRRRRRIRNRETSTLTVWAATVARSGPRRPHVEPGHQEQVPEDIDDAGDGNGEQRGPGVADPPENGAQDVVGHNKEGAGPADADVQHRLMERVLRRVHEPGQYLGSTHQDGSEQDGEAGEQADAAADGAARILRLPPADPLPHQDGGPHGQAVTTMVTVWSSMLPVATPETSAVWANWPTTSRSTPP